eukprot:TRINITY_DN4009_c0_g1_i2.p1 TRINITY_DN4009_c0_g1~~TRINITY_DN4009_c0_g1_i2.p1  ORF type:complete len:241 (+),score=75.93 TRINITY_DN4009_c0_g1_i2:83-805(+)
MLRSLVGSEMCIRDRGKTSVLKLITREAPERLHQADEDGRTMLHHAAEQDQVQFILKAMQEGCDMNAIDQVSRTPLHMTAFSGALEAAKLLIEADCDLDVQDGEGKTALHWAVRNFKEDIAALLVTKNADMSLKDHCGETPEAYARSSDRLSAVLADPSLVAIGKESTASIIDPSKVPEKIVAKQKATNGQIMYRVKFKGLNFSQAAWYTSKDVKGWIPKMIEEFEVESVRNKELRQRYS